MKLKKKKIFLTGATGIMGSAALVELLKRRDIFDITLIIRPRKQNKKFIERYSKEPGVSIIIGDLCNPEDVRRGVADADYILHVGGMVSPKADRYPSKTWKVNTESMQNIVTALKERPDADSVGVVYIGSVSQYGDRQGKQAWGRCGDPMIAAVGDYYALSKIEAEKILAESGLKRWVSLRQTGILYPELLFNGSDPIAFHVPLNGVLEWVTVEDSGRLLAKLCETELSEDFWGRFYNIGGGEKFRLTNYQFEQMLLKALSCPPVEKVFKPQWFALRNFHGIWYTDSDKLEKIIPYRLGNTAEEYFKQMASELPSYFRLASIVPSAIIKFVMKQVAGKERGTLHWLKANDEERLKAYYGSRDKMLAIGDWPEIELVTPDKKETYLSHGYDERKPESELDIEDMRSAALFRGGKCLSASMKKGDLAGKLDWECAFGHKFRMSTASVLLGGHWCPECLPPDWNYDAEAKVNPYLAQVWYSTHSPEENNKYPGIRL